MSSFGLEAFGNQQGVAVPHKSYLKLLPQWTRCRDCYEGQDAIKAKQSLYLPPLDSHKEQGQLRRYAAYLMRALFYNAFGRTVIGLAGFVMQKPPNIREGDKALDEDLKDVTQAGEGFEAFSLEALQEILITGRYGILVDIPQSEVAAIGEPVVNQGARPYWSAYRATDIISWKTERRGVDPSVLTRVVLREEKDLQDPKNEFKIDAVVQYRELGLDGEGKYFQRVWRKPTKEGTNDSSSDRWQIHETIIPKRFGEALDFIPFVPIGATSLNIGPSKPPLLDLADLNLSHYRSSADLEHGRHFTALPTPWVSGLQDSDDPLEIGSGTAWLLDVNGKAGMLEFTGAGLESLTQADVDKSKKMAVLGARLLEGQNDVGETATAILMRHAGEGATLRSVVSIIQLAFTRVIQIHVYWTTPSAKDSKKVKAHVEFNKDFFAIRLTPQEIQAIVAALQAEAISFKTFYHGLSQGGWARPGITAEQEKADIEKDSPPVGKNPNAGLDLKLKPGGDVKPKPGEEGDEGEGDDG